MNAIKMHELSIVINNEEAITDQRNAKYYLILHFHFKKMFRSIRILLGPVCSLITQDRMSGVGQKTFA
jgi:hypothetical protein